MGKIFSEITINPPFHKRYKMAATNKVCPSRTKQWFNIRPYDITRV